MVFLAARALLAGHRAWAASAAFESVGVHAADRPSDPYRQKLPSDDGHGLSISRPRRQGGVESVGSSRFDPRPHQGPRDDLDLLVIER
jgi:hypothetical protein